MSKFGSVGVDVGRVGRWIRLGLGLILIALIGRAVADALLRGPLLPTTNFLALTAVYLVAFLAAYTAAHFFLGERLLARRNPWIGTAILLIPAYVIAVTTSGPPVVGFILFAAVSHFFAWRSRYGGCEVVAIPNLLFHRRYKVYCIPLVAVDVLEKKVVERRKLGVEGGARGNRRA